MFTARRKIQKEKGQEPDEFEESVAQALFDLESTNNELKSELRDLFINSAKEVDVSGNRKAVIIHVPYRLRKAFQKIHARLVRELEKKFSGKVRLYEYSLTLIFWAVWRRHLKILVLLSLLCSDCLCLDVWCGRVF